MDVPEGLSPSAEPLRRDGPGLSSVSEKCRLLCLSLLPSGTALVARAMMEQ